jgi:hypothetical protein
MIIVCKHTLIPGRTSSEEYVNLTIGKKYKALTDMLSADFMVELVDDDGDKCWYPKDNFYILQSYREDKLKQLGI